VLEIVVMGSALAASASAQFFEDRPWSYRPRHSPFLSWTRQNLKAGSRLRGIVSTRAVGSGSRGAIIG
jgi:hypothetical protein